MLKEVSQVVRKNLNGSNGLSGRAQAAALALAIGLGAMKVLSRPCFFYGTKIASLFAEALSQACWKHVHDGGESNIDVEVGWNANQLNITENVLTADVLVLIMHMDCLSHVLSAA